MLLPITIGRRRTAGFAVRVRRVFARRPALFWLLVIACSATTAAAARSAVAGVEEEREAWGASAEVWMTTGDVEAGERLDEVATQRWVPAALVPDEPLTSLADGAVALHRLGAGEIVSSADVSGGRGTRELAPRGSRIVAVVESVPSGARVGQLAQVAAGGVVLTEDAVVVGTYGEATLLAVAGPDAAAVAAAAAESTATLLVAS